MRFLTGWLGLAVIWVGMLAHAAAPRPNILFIMTDDHAAHAIGAYGSRVNQTPNLDQLARQGLRLDRCFAVNSICTPSRATILTGQYSHRNGVPVFNNLDPSTVTVAHRLHDAGYYTAMLASGTWDRIPKGSMRGIFFRGRDCAPDPASGMTGTASIMALRRMITDLAITLLETRPKGPPFFLMCHHKAPHREWTPSERYRQEFAARTIP